MVEVTEALFGQHIRSLRRARGLTQEQLAVRAKMSTDTVRRIEGGTMSSSLRTIRALAHGLELSLATLFESMDLLEVNVGRELLDHLQLLSERERLLLLSLSRSLFEGPHSLPLPLRSSLTEGLRKLEAPQDPNEAP